MLITDYKNLETAEVIGELSGEPVNMDIVKSAAKEIKQIIDLDDLEIGSGEIIWIYSRLTNDEKMQVGGLLKDKVPDSGPIGRMYGSILIDYLQYIPE